MQKRMTRLSAWTPRCTVGVNDGAPEVWDRVLIEAPLPLGAGDRSFEERGAVSPLRAEPSAGELRPSWWGSLESVEGSDVSAPRAERSEGELRRGRDSCPVASGEPDAACLRPVVGRRRPSVAREMASPTGTAKPWLAEFSAFCALV